MNKITSHMKKSILSIIIAIMAIGVGHAQIKEGMIAQPTHIVGKRIDAGGEVTSTLEADFTYNEDGRPLTSQSLTTVCPPTMCLPTSTCPKNPHGMTTDNLNSMRPWTTRTKRAR